MVKSLLSAGDIGIIDPIVKCHSLPWKFMNTHQQIQMNSVKLSHPIQSHEKSPFKSQPPLNPIEIPLKSPYFIPMKSHEITSKRSKSQSSKSTARFSPRRPETERWWPLDTAESAARASCRDAHGEVRSAMRQKWWNDGGIMVILMVFHHYYTIIQNDITEVFNGISRTYTIFNHFLFCNNGVIMVIEWHLMEYFDVFRWLMPFYF